MTYVDAAHAPLRKTGQIKLHGADAFAGMRKAGRLVAECLDMLVPQIRPGVTTDERERVRELEREVKELRRANEILKAVSAFFAAELDGPKR